MIAVAIEPKTKADQEKLGIALQLGEEDPTFRSNRRGNGQTIIRGMGELHLEIIVDRMMREFKVEANVGKPQVAYRETVAQAGRESRTPAMSVSPVVGPVRPRRDQHRAG